MILRFPIRAAHLRIGLVSPAFYINAGVYIYFLGLVLFFLEPAILPTYISLAREGGFLAFCTGTELSIPKTLISYLSALSLSFLIVTFETMQALTLTSLRRLLSESGFL
jgi:hypothetical protein